MTNPNIDYSVAERFLENLARAYTEYNADYIIPHLSDKFHYNSMWVTAPDLKKEEYIDYIQGKLASMQRTQAKLNFCVVYVQGSGEPHLLCTQKTARDVKGCFVVKIDENNQVEELSLTSADLYRHGYKDKEKYELFIKNIE